MEHSERIYPVGRQVFADIRKENLVYVDKTAYIYHMTHSGSKYVFLSRPRRFGKSLLIYTLRSYFEGRKELFEGLAIGSLEKEWTQHPVLHFQMNYGKHADREGLESMLSRQLSDYEDIYGRKAEERNLNDRLAGIIQRAYRQTGQGVVVLIDEYDAPLLDVLHEDQNLPALRNVLRNFYSPLKPSEEYLRFVFLTGITKFAQLSIFSELNNIRNISMEERYAAICGITEEELCTQMDADLKLMAKNMNTSYERVLELLKEYYDGYHFAWPSPDVYNPYSLITAFSSQKLASYWFGSGTPTYLIEMLKKYHVAPSEIGHLAVKESAFDAPTEGMTTLIPLLYQSGYLTIKGYEEDIDIYHLDIPNKEVREGLMESLLPLYVGSEEKAATTTAAYISRDLRNDHIDAALKRLQAFLSTIPYCQNTHHEGHYQQMLYVIFSLLGAYVDVEVRTARGRIDIVLRTHTKLYVMELKLDKSANVAMKQIDLKDYPARFAFCGLPVVKVAINFSSDTRTLESWVIEEE